MKIIILGCGYIGYNLAQQFYRKKEDVLVVGLDSYYVPLLAAPFIEGNAFDADFLNTIDFKNAVVIDAMNLIQPNRIYENKDEQLQKVMNQYKLLFAVLEQKEINRFITFSSGGTVYGDSDSVVNEESALNPSSFYADSKVMLENFLQITALPYLIIRLANPYGGIQEGNKTQGVIPILVRKALNKEPFHLWGELDFVRDYIYISDFFEALQLLIKNKKVLNEIVNIGTGKGTTLEELIITIETMTQSSIQIHKEEATIPFLKKNVLDITKLRRLTGFEPKVDIQEGIFYEIERIR